MWHVLRLQFKFFLLFYSASLGNVQITLLNRVLKAPFPFLWWCTNFNLPYLFCSFQTMQLFHLTEPGDSVVTHETRIREVPDSNPVADQRDWGFFVVFLSHQGKWWVGFSLPRSIWPLFIKFIFIFILAVPAASLAYLKRFIKLYGRQCVFQVTGKNAFSAMNNYNSQALKM